RIPRSPPLNLPRNLPPNPSGSIRRRIRRRIKIPPYARVGGRGLWALHGLAPRPFPSSFAASLRTRRLMSQLSPDALPIDGSEFSFGIVAARFNGIYIEGLLSGVIETLRAAGAP